MENKVKKAIIKKIELYSTIIMLATTPIVFTGCSDQIVKEPTKIEISNEEETLSTNEVSENSVVSNNTVSENIIEEEGPVFTKSLTQDEKDKIAIDEYNKLISNPPIDGIINPETDFSKSDSIYKNDKNYQREYTSVVDYAYLNCSGSISEEENREYVGVKSIKGFAIYAATETLSIITLNDNLEKYFIIKDYQGEDTILKDSYLDFCTGNKLEEDITNFNVTSMNEYLNKYYDSSYLRGPGYVYINDYTTFAISQYKNIGKAK